MEIKLKKIINFGLIKIKLKPNNVFITLTDFSGNVLMEKHAGLSEFKSSKRRTPFVASVVFKSLVRDLRKTKYHIKVFILQIRKH